MIVDVVAWGAFVSVLHHVVLQRVYLRRVLLAQHLMVLMLRGERVLDVQRLVLFGWGGLHGVLQLVLGIRIILRNDSPMLDLCNNLILFITSPTFIIIIFFLIRKCATVYLLNYLKIYKKH